jgi:hypothetical protein
MPNRTFMHDTIAGFAHMRGDGGRHSKPIAFAIPNLVGV